MNFHGYSGCYKRKITSYLTIKRIETDRNITQNIGKSQSKKICIEIQNSFLLNGSFSGFRIIGFHNYLRKAEFCQRNPVGAACRRFHLKPKIAVRCTGFYYIRFVRRSFCIRQITQRRQQSGLALIIILSIKSIAAQNIWDCLYCYCHDKHKRTGKWTKHSLHPSRPQYSEGKA